MLKLSPSLLLVALTLGSTDAFGVNVIPSLAKSTSAAPSSLFATVEKTSLVPPSDIPSDDVPSLFENYVMKTYG